jgi:hypothetical protein
LIDAAYSLLSISTARSMNWSASSRSLLPRFNVRMPELTRRRSEHHPQECWHVYYGDVHVGTIAERVGNLRGNGTAASIRATDQFE